MLCRRLQQSPNQGSLTMEAPYHKYALTAPMRTVHSMYTIHIITLFCSVCLCVCVCRHCCKVLQSIPPVVNRLSEHLDNVNWCKGYSLEQSSLVHTHTY